MAEHPVIGPPPAILNAIQYATGVSLTKLPVTPDIMLKVLKQRNQQLWKSQLELTKEVTN